MQMKLHATVLTIIISSEATLRKYFKQFVVRCSLDYDFTYNSCMFRRTVLSKIEQECVYFHTHIYIIHDLLCFEELPAPLCCRLCVGVGILRTRVRQVEPDFAVLTRRRSAT